jgi:hypothetical protein
MVSHKRKLSEFEFNIAPSSFGKPSGNHSWPSQIDKFGIFFHRPSPKNCGVHCSLMDITIARFFDNIKLGELTRTDYAFALKYCTAMSGVFDVESQRSDLSANLLSDYLGHSIGRTMIGTGNICTDGTIFAKCGGGNVQNMAMVLNKEVKNELGKGDCSAPEQCVAYYCNAIAWNVTKYAQERSTCPALLISLCGPYLSVSAVTYGKNIAVDPVTPLLSLLVLPQDRGMMESSARALAATKRCVSELVNFYNSLPATAVEGAREATENIPPQLHFPYPRELLGGAIEFRYIERIFDDKLLFAVELTRVNEAAVKEHGVEVGTVIIVKFTRSYCPEAHQVCYEAEHSAPRLYGCEQLPGGWQLVAMEYLSDAVTLQPQQSVNTSVKLRAAVAAVHGAGYVHGDLRECNVLVCGGGLRLCVIDFDWSGKEGVQRYPTFMNHADINWAEGAEDGQPLRKQHDLHFLNLLVLQ